MKRHLFLTAVGMAIGGAASAQSSVTLYGNLDSGVSYATNVKGKSMTAVNGVGMPTQFGLRGREDLGNGLAATFNLNSGFSVDTGTQINPAKFWNRESTVGLSSRTLGSIYIGRQGAPMYDVLGKYSNGYNLFNFSLYHNGNIDGLANTRAFDNSIKYVSPKLGGFHGTAILGLSEGTGRRAGAGLNYQNGNFRAGLGYDSNRSLTLDFAGSLGVANTLGRTFTPGSSVKLDKATTYGIGAAYRFQDLSGNIAYTQTKLELGSASTTPKYLDIGLTYRATPANWIMLGYSNSRLGGARWNTYSLQDVYWLSKRTKAYVYAIMQRANNNAQAGLNGIGLSSSQKQSIVGFGLMHSF